MEFISIKSPREMEQMRRACRLTAAARALAGSMVRTRVSNHEIDPALRKLIDNHRTKPNLHR